MTDKEKCSNCGESFLDHEIISEEIQLCKE